MNDLIERLERAIEELQILRNRAASNHNMSEHSRLFGKIEGVKLALGYARESLQMAAYANATVESGGRS